MIILSPIPVTKYLNRDRIQLIEAAYTDFEKGKPIADLVICEPSMQGVSDIQQAARSGENPHPTILQEMVLTKDRKIAWSQQFISSLPASLLMPLAIKCHEIVEDLFKRYDEEAKAMDGDKKKEGKEGEEAEKKA